MTQLPAQETILRCLDRARDVLGPEQAAMLTDALTDAWQRSADEGANAAIFASGWLSARAHRWRSLDPIVSNYLSRLAELSASAWLDEIAVQTTQIPDYPPEDDHDFEQLYDPVREQRAEPSVGDLAARRHLSSEELRPECAQGQPLALRHPRSADPSDDAAGEAVSIFTRKPAYEPMPPLDPDDLDPHPSIAQRLADVKQDDIRTYVETGGELDAWPDGWNVKGDDWYIEPADRPYYHRDRAIDLKIVEQMRELVHQANRTGVAQRVTIEEAERVTHKQAVARARALRKHAEQLARDAQLDRTTYRCESCGTTGDHSVKPRTIVGVTKPSPLYGWRLCDPCTPAVERAARQLLDQRAADLAEQDTPNGKRGDLAAQYVERLLS